MRKFAFLIHPRDTSDIFRRFQFVRLIPLSAIDIVMKNLSGRAGFTICAKEINFFRRGEEVCGYIIAVLLNGKQMMSLSLGKVRQRILDAVLYAQNELKVDVVGLGSLTASVTNSGRWLARHPEVKTTITHGDTFTVAVAQQGIKRILNKRGLNSQNGKIAVVGAYGIIGRELCLFLARRNYKLFLVESVLEKIKLIENKMAKENLKNFILSASIDLGDVCSADLVITATSHPSCLIKSAHLKKNAVVYDIAQPINLGSEVISERPDVLKIDGDYVDIDGIDLKFSMGLPQNKTFACLVETAMIAIENDRRHHVGEINGKFLKETRRWGEKYGFRHAEFTSFNKPINW